MGQNQHHLAGKVILVVLTVLITLGCNSQEPVGWLFAAPSDGADKPSIHAGKTPSWPAAPPAAMQPLAAMQADAPSEYRFVQAVAGSARTVTAWNPAQRLAIQARSDGVVHAERRHAHLPWTVVLAWTGLGRGEVLEPVDSGGAGPSVDGSRLTYQYGGGRQAWYANGPLGLEQGFVLDAPPAGQTSGEAVAIEVAVRGDLAPVPSARTQKVALRLPHGETKAWYGKLFAFDAQGRTLPSWMEATDSAIRLRVVDAEAVYPIVIDPLLITDQGKLLPSDGLPDDYFGTSVAVEGDTAVVGAPGPYVGTKPGAAYVFVRTGGAWTEQAKLLASDGMAGNGFGVSVALQGDTAIVGAPGSYSSAYPGAVYVFVRTGGAWTEQVKLLPSDGMDGDWFGTSVALQGDTASWERRTTTAPPRVPALSTSLPARVASGRKRRSFWPATPWPAIGSAPPCARCGQGARGGT